MAVVAFMGERKSGKDYFCEYIDKKFYGTRLSFSDELRRLTVDVFPWLPFDVPAEQKDDPFPHIYNPNNHSMRDIWKILGKVRDVDPKFFVRKFKENQYSNRDPERSNRLHIITDFRTPDEWDFLQAAKIPVIKIVRENRDGIEPDPFEQYVRDFTEYDGIFINKLDGTSSFHDYFVDFCAVKNIPL
jgi:hypothetical protein